MIKNLLKEAFNGNPNILQKLLQTEKERIDYARNRSLYMN